MPTASENQVIALLAKEWDMTGPPGIFSPHSGVKTNLIFFERTGPAKRIWYYEILPLPGKKFSKGNPIQDEHFKDCSRKAKSRALSDQSWIVPVKQIVERNYDLTAKNPNRKEEKQVSPTGQYHCLHP
jgi:type I restriction enzyme M protein